MFIQFSLEVDEIIREKVLKINPTRKQIETSTKHVDISPRSEKRR